MTGEATQPQPRSQTPGGYFQLGQRWQDIYGQEAEIVSIGRLPWCGRPNSSHAVKWLIELRWIEWRDYPTFFKSDLSMRCDWTRSTARSQQGAEIVVASPYEQPRRRRHRLSRREYRRARRAGLLR